MLVFQPQSDLAIANGIMHLLIAANADVATDFVEKHCNFRKPDEARRPSTGRR
jgi:anaerobic selenocysteine-containing dehydrogenase